MKSNEMYEVNQRSSGSKISSSFGSKFSIDTGSMRSINGHIVSGALGVGIASIPLICHKMTRGESTPKDACVDAGIKMLQGGVATGCAISAANLLGKEGGWLKALGMVGVGMAGVYAAEQLSKVLKRDESQEGVQESA